jgi:diacylglycerol kinase family enzyme
VSADPSARPGEVGAGERIALIINPRATTSGTAVRSRVARELGPLGTEWTLVTRSRDDTAQMARRAVASGATLIVALGGDGTAADIAAVLADSPVALAPLPGGNANVFSRALGWPGDIDGALGLLGEAVRRGSRRRVQMGRIVGEGLDHPFIVNCGVGIDAATVEWIEARPRTKHRLRHAGYALGLAKATRRARRDASLVEVRPEEGDPLAAVTVLVACGSPYTYLRNRPLDLVPGADFDGTLRWAALRRLSAGAITRLMMAAARGRPPRDDDDNVALGDVGQRLEIHARAPVAVQADGEFLGHHEQIAITPGSLLQVLIPAAP